MKVKINEISFEVDSTISTNHIFSSIGENGLDKWEPGTFHILDLFKNDKGILIDIGAWIGPISLYSASLYKKIIAIEADPVAIEAIKANIKFNDFKNIHLIEKAISNTDNSEIIFGGNGPLGNSESTMLVNENNFLDIETKWKNNHNEIVKVNTIKFETLIKELDLDHNEIKLIKIDIEGGEKIIIPDMKNYLISVNIPMWMSLHPSFLEKSDIYMIVNILFEIYNKCFYINSNKEKVEIKKETILEETDIYYSIPNHLTMMNGGPGTRYFELLFEK